MGRNESLLLDEDEAADRTQAAVDAKAKSVSKKHKNRKGEEEAVRGDEWRFRCCMVVTVLHAGGGGLQRGLGR